jgi:hypothetical protein
LGFLGLKICIPSGNPAPLGKGPSRQIGYLTIRHLLNRGFKLMKSYTTKTKQKIPKKWERLFRIAMCPNFGII